MGQGFVSGVMVGTTSSLMVAPMQLSLVNHILISAGGAGVGLLIDLLSDCVAREGKIVVHRNVVLNAEDRLCHVYTFYSRCESNPLSKLLMQKHEWLVLESHGHRFYTVQKSPINGDVMMDVRTSLRSANDLGLSIAGRPTLSGEIRQHRVDMEFDLPYDVSVAYMIAWLRKEDPRWSFSTENSRHFTARARYALSDF